MIMGLKQHWIPLTFNSFNSKTRRGSSLRQKISSTHTVERKSHSKYACLTVGSDGCVRWVYYPIKS